MNLQVIVLLTLIWCVASRDYEDDESRPYEFGFTIDGEQHRHESKDINGIIMGEFGFITADGIYHVTVYATDENGKFKILSMRNVKISEPLDQSGYKAPHKVQRESTNPATSTNSKSPYEFTTIPSLNVRACSSCRLPSTTSAPKGAIPQLPFQTPLFQKNPIRNDRKLAIFQTNPPNHPMVNNFGSNFPPKNTNPPNVNQEPLVSSFQTNPPTVDNFESNSPPNSTNQPNFNQEAPAPSLQTNPPDHPTVNNFLSNNTNPPNLNQEPLQINPPTINNFRPNPPNRDQEPPPPPPPSPQLTPNPSKINNPITNFQIFPPPPTEIQPQPHITVTKKQINIPGHDPIPIKDKYPNMVDGLPIGIHENDMLDLLYKFNYTVGFHGHHEKGLRNGSKIGAYFVNGRDGISRVVEYVADERGYRPKVKLINLNYDSPDWPKPETEKTFGLKGYEFVWYPL